MDLVSIHSTFRYLTKSSILFCLKFIFSSRKSSLKLWHCCSIEIDDYLCLFQKKTRFLDLSIRFHSKLIQSSLSFSLSLSFIPFYFRASALNLDWNFNWFCFVLFISFGKFQHSLQTHRHTKLPNTDRADNRIRIDTKQSTKRTKQNLHFFFLILFPFYSLSCRALPNRKSSFPIQIWFIQSLIVYNQEVPV